MSRWLRFLGTSLLLMATACVNDLTEPWDVIEPRLLAARVEVTGAPERTRPRFGESFTLRQYLALPHALGAARYDMSAALCLAFKAPDGSATCIGEQALTPAVQTISDTEIALGPLSLDLAAVAAAIAAAGVPGLAGVPADGDLAQLAAQFGVDRIAVFGVLCVDGRAERVPNTSLRTTVPSSLFRCADNGASAYPDPHAFTLSVLLDLGRTFDQNRNPSFACDASAPSPCTDGVAAPGEARVAGPIVLARPAARASAPREVIPWSAPNVGAAVPWEGCAADPALPKVRANSGKHEVRLRFDPSDRDSYQYQIRQNGTLVVRDDRESLLIAHAISERGGELQRHFSQVNGDVADADTEVVFDYEPPKGRKDSDDDVVIPDSGRLVRFYFSLRDQRGGVDFTTRALCLLPPAPAQ